MNIDFWKTKVDEIKYLIRSGMNNNELADHYGISIDQFRYILKTLRDKSLIGKHNEILAEQETEDLHQSLLKLLSKGISREDIQEKIGISERVLNILLDELHDEGYMVDKIEGMLNLRRIPLNDSIVSKESWNGDKIIRFGIASDPHMCSKHQQLTHLNTMYDIFAREGITIVYNPGDMTDGHNMRRGHEYEIFEHGADAQTKYVIKNYPRRPGIKTKFITGNHDHTHIKAAGHDIGVPIARDRDDMEYLGINYARIMLTPNCSMDIHHPLDGASYALSYSTQKAIEAWSSDNLPNIYVTGHHHKAIYMYYRDIHALEAGCFEAQTPWMRGKRIAAHVGGWIVTVHVNDDGEVTRFAPEFISFPKSIENDY